MGTVNDGRVIGGLAPHGWALGASALVVLVAAICILTLAVTDPATAVMGAIALATLLAFALLPPHLGAALLLLLSPLRLWVDLPGVGGALSLASALMLGLGVILLFRRLGEGPPALTRWEWLVVIWLGWMTLSVAWSVNPGASLRGVYNWSCFFSFLFIAGWSLLRAQEPTRAAQTLISVFLVLVAVWCVIGFVEVGLGYRVVGAVLKSPFGALVFNPGDVGAKLGALGVNWQIGDTDSVTPFGPFPNGIMFGIFTAMGIGVAAVALVSRLQYVPRWLAIGTLALALAANVACLKATGWVAGGAALVTAFLAHGGSVRRLLKWSAAVVLTLGLALFLLRDLVKERLAELAARELVNPTAAADLSRPAIWLHYAKAVMRRPLIGYGLYTSEIYGPTHSSVATGTNVSIDFRLPPENGYLALAVDTGLVGVMLGIIALGAAVVLGVRLSRRYSHDPLAQTAGAAAAGMAAGLVGNVSVSGLSDEITGVMLTTMMAIVMLARRRVGAAATADAP
jgi:O-antigen ligase